jgi:dephospho-CoA kinase
LTLRVGLTGGIACGKSRVRQRLAAAGFSTLDLDHIAHEVMAPGGAAYREVVEAFGPAILAADGSVDRRRLGDVVFADPKARARLDAIVHPRVREEEARRAALGPDRPDEIVVTDAALLVEAGVHLRFDRLVVVHCSADQQVERLMRRDGIDEAAARARVAAQMPTDEKRGFAHFEVDASGSLAETDQGTDRVAAELRRLALSRPARVAIPLERRVGAMVVGPRRGPRGLDRERVLANIAAAGGLEMERVARLLVPPADGPWYRAARPQEEIGPETLVGPVVIWALSRGGPDPDFVAAAAASLARLTHTGGETIAGACLFALALLEALTSGVAGRNLTERLPEWNALARRWGGNAPPERIAAAMESAARHGNDPGSARTAGPDPAWDELAAGLVAAAIGVPVVTAPPFLLDTLAALHGPGPPDAA